MATIFLILSEYVPNSEAIWHITDAFKIAGLIAALFLVVFLLSLFNKRKQGES